MKLRALALVVGLTLASYSGTAHASYLFRFTQTLDGVLETGSGSLDVSELSLLDSGEVGHPYVYPTDPGASVGAPQTQDAYAANFGASQAFGTGSGSETTTGLGPLVGFEGGTEGVITVPTGFTSGSLGSSSTLFTGETFSSLGLTPGTYVYNYSYQSSGEIAAIARVAFAQATLGTITVQVGTVPLPASAPMFGTALLALGAIGYRLKRNAKVAA